MEVDHTPSNEKAPHGVPETSGFESLTDIQEDLKRVIDALALLGIRRCCRCRRFFRSSDPGALFDSGKLVCYACVPEWWRGVSERLRVEDREKLETKLASWLRKHHGGEIVKQETGKTIDLNVTKFHIVVRCNECLGSGRLLEGERCRFCNGFGTVRVVVPT